MSESRTSVTVKIAGEEHVIRSNAPADYTRACARFVDERIREIRDRGIEGHRAAILAALSITDQFFRARDDEEALRARVEGSAEALAARIEGLLSEERG
ncbi:MAG: cell division protein ZapA [Gemmatimonadota bacterium]